MIRATKQFRAEIAHRLPNHPGQCKFLHGHSYLFEVSVERFAGGVDEEKGMVMDFHELKEIMAEIIGPWDHSLILWEEDPLFTNFLASIPMRDVLKLNLVPFIPTAENMAGWVAAILTQRLPRPLEVTSVKVWETTTSFAEWRRK